MRFLDSSDASGGMTADSSSSAAKDRPALISYASTASPDLSDLSLQPAPPSPLTSSYEHISLPSSSPPLQRPKARLIYCKAHVVIHPSQSKKDNVSGYLGIVEADGDVVKTDVESEAEVLEGETARKQLLITWVPDELLDRMEDEDKDGYKRMEGRSIGRIPSTDEEEDGFIFVSLPSPKGETYAFSVPLSGIYSILVYPPSLSHWYGTATINLMGGVSLPTLYFHDDKSPPLVSDAASPGPRSASPPRSRWGFPPFLSILGTRASLLRSRLLTSRSTLSAELWLIHPSRADREVHEAGVQAETAQTGHPAIERSGANNLALPYPPQRKDFPDPSIVPVPLPTPKQTLLTGLSNITSFSRRMSQQLLATPIGQEVIPHLPPALRSFVNAPGESGTSSRLRPKTGRSGDVASEFESARLYLARWARVVAEEGERARRSEVVGRVGKATGERVAEADLASSLGVFSLLTSPNSKRAIPQPTRTPQLPIASQDWESFAAQGRDELWIRREIFKRGFSDSQEPEEKRTRREGWEVLLGIVPWSEGGLGGGETGKKKRMRARETKRDDKRQEYSRLKDKWTCVPAGGEKEALKDEWHRIDVDCRRTDRTQAIFAIPTEALAKGDAEKAAGGPRHDLDGKEDEEEGVAAKLNPHIAKLRSILMTYHAYSPELGYVQGMSDLLSPIYVVFEANEADAFWGLVGVMKMMESNFLRDQSGMKRQLSTLQQLIGIMDPELYAHLERTDSLNLFFCFRWILIAFKREFKFDTVIRLWEILWSRYYSNHLVLFVALAVLQSHRDGLLRYLTEFDEVLKYANDLSGSIDLDTTLAQAEVLFLSFCDLVADLDKERADAVDGVSASLRQRKGSALGRVSDGWIGPVGESREGPREIPESLRELLVGWEREV